MHAAESRTRRRVLAIIDGSGDLSGRSNQDVVVRASQLAHELDAELHVATSYPAVDAVPRNCQVVRYLPALNVKARDRQRGAIAALLRGLRIHADSTHVEAGLADVIATLAAKLHADVTVAASQRDGVAEILIRYADAPEGGTPTQQAASVSRQR